jgi:HlyD family secretion protein
LSRSLRLISLLLLAAALGACGGDKSVRGSGTIEMDETDLASQVGGRVVRMNVEEGDHVNAGDTVAVLDRGEIAAELAAQMAQAQRAQSQAKDQAQGARPAEVLVARAQLAAAAADRQLADAQYARIAKLAATQAVSQSDLDRARATRDAAAAHEKAASEQARLLEDGYRHLQVDAARQGATAAMAQLAGARSRASELVMIAPREGVVLLKNFERGELVNPGLPVITIGSPDSLWMRVYVAAPLLSQLHLGEPVAVRPIGAKQEYAGRVIQIATQAEFTPRAALTEEEQANLVFAVKIKLAPTNGQLKAGLPADAHFGRLPR